MAAATRGSGCTRSAGENSIYRKIAATDADVRMPPPGQMSLTKDQIDVVRRWIEEGAKWPDDAVLR